MVCLSDLKVRGWVTLSSEWENPATICPFLCHWKYLTAICKAFAMLQSNCLRQWPFLMVGQILFLYPVVHIWLYIICLCYLILISNNFPVTCPQVWFFLNTRSLSLYLCLPFSIRIFLTEIRSLSGSPQSFRVGNCWAKPAALRKLSSSCVWLAMAEAVREKCIWLCQQYSAFSCWGRTMSLWHCVKHPEAILYSPQDIKAGRRNQKKRL